MFGFFNDIGKGIEHAAKEVGKGVEHAAKEVGKGVEHAANEVAKGAGDVGQFGLQVMRDIGDGVGGLLNLEFSMDLDDSHLLKLLAACAEHCYEPDSKDPDFESHLELVHSQEETGMNSNAFAVYRVKTGHLAGKRIMAFRGTSSAGGAFSDISFALRGAGAMGARIWAVISYAVDRTHEFGPDYVCGHSLGGFLAECVCSHTGIGGAAFNGPASRAVIPANNCANGSRFSSARFEVHQTKGDTVSNVCSFGGPNASHIGKPKWHNGPPDPDPLKQHSMKAMVDDIGRLGSSDRHPRPHDEELVGVFNIWISGGTNRGKSILSCAPNGLVDLWERDDNSGRQKWRLEKTSDGYFNIWISGGTNHGKSILSCRADGLVDLWERDDNSGRQKWKLEKTSDGYVNIWISGGTNRGKSILSCRADGLVDLWERDDNSGRQKWRLERIE